MNQAHEYTLIGGVNRAKVGRYLGVLSASISALVVFLLLAAVDVAQRFGIPANLPPSVLSLLGAGSVFAALYWFFDRYAWRWTPFAKFLDVPKLAGEWTCDGQTLDSAGQPTYTWAGTVTIVQSWDKLRVRLKTQHSSSSSISAAIVRDDVDGYVLLYHYRNEPKIDEPELKGHRGFAELTFSKDGQTAHGEYFNGHGRYTFGTLRLQRKK